MSAPQAPLVHMNGTSRDTLASVNTHARLCLREALEALYRLRTMLPSASRPVIPPADPIT